MSTNQKIHLVNRQAEALLLGIDMLHSTYRNHEVNCLVVALRDYLDVWRAAEERDARKQASASPLSDDAPRANPLPDNWPAGKLTTIR